MIVVEGPRERISGIPEGLGVNAWPRRQRSLIDAAATGWKRPDADGQTQLFVAVQAAPNTESISAVSMYSFTFAICPLRT